MAKSTTAALRWEPKEVHVAFPLESLLRKSILKTWYLIEHLLHLQLSYKG